MQIKNSEPIKFSWEKEDTFDSIHKKMLMLVDKNVVSCENPDSFFTIFKVSEIKEGVIGSLGFGFGEFLDGNPEYFTKDGGYNFKGLKENLVWEFEVEFGTEWDNGYKYSNVYKVNIPRQGNYKDDLKLNNICVINNHPFIHYPKEWIH